MPLGGRETVDRHVVRVVEAVATVLLDFAQGERLVALFAEQEPAVIHRLTGVTGFAHHRLPRVIRLPRPFPAGAAVPCPG